MNVHAPIPADLRAQFPGVGEWHYLDSAATAQKPRAVIEAIARGYGEDYATVHRGVYDRSANMTRAYEAARATVARFLGGAAGEVVFTRGATEAINLVAASWGRDHVGAGDAILLSRLEHHSNIVPWQMLAQAVGAEIRVAEVREDGQIDLDSLRDRLDGRVKIVALSHLSNVTGALLDAPAVAAMAREVGAAFLLDGCQAAPRLPLDVAALGCDFYVASAHKMYGPTGIGALWAKAGLLDAMPPYQGGGSMIDRVSFEEGTTYAPAPTRFEAGTPHIVGAIGFGAACDWIEGVGREAIAAHENALVAATREGLRARNDIALYGPADAHGIVSFNMDGVHAHDVATILDDVGVAVRAGHHCCQPLMDRLGVPATVRASFAAHSDMGDVEALLDGLEKVKRIFG
ncbi:aminotransferase class V-fold PLP-dependent enzyme [Sphingomicrobium astaxanthinifaciens]|uniref:aminotransferase class V-fold PLP-dependent enzyme n=1 Tax=Sphingomicrobium astaxanthinifaciens TaxID=1227949 RepID=UPI001FCB8096|nr:cysteine desulfurase [Sphingomicrobium astaxanthinifaciens]MCJ7421319.1 cysteine desulfurase [Sphingomicrobium astaxanthinifaciens]